MKSLTVLSLLSSCPVAAFVLQEPSRTWSAILLQATLSPHGEEDRRAFLSTVATTAGALVTGALTTTPQSAQAIGPVKIALEPMSYKAAACPPSKPIPGEKAMFGMRGLCVTVQAKMAEGSPKDLEKVGVYGFVTDGETGNSVLANNPDLSTDAGQFAMIESVTTKDKIVEFEFVAAVPADKDISKYENGIGPLDFERISIISFPGGQQFGAINPCEMNEFSDECEAWEKENGPYEKQDYMMKQNARTKGR
mmetsp:Transcript_25452/g.48222  ORF Transcript_25452/g.48222 Transcript_25452/m.48222 type:complete len:251 (+) Transcript_25452:98-850(+)